ncbi:DNA repair protein SWI5 homolog [Pholidichthys leucotaenia]
MNTEQRAADVSPLLASSPEERESKKGAPRRTPFSKSKKVNSHFKSPLQPGRNPHTETSPGAAEELTELRRRREHLQAEISQLEQQGYRMEELERHIHKLHEYNDVKDAAQTLLGRIAAVRGTTTADLYQRFGLELDD